MSTRWVEAGRSIPLTGMRRAIATRMHASLQEMAQLTLGCDVVMDRAVELRTSLAGSSGEDARVPSFTDMVIASVARALREHPSLNARVEADRIELLDEVSVSMAVALDAGLIVPVVPGTDRMPLHEIAATTRRLAEAARDGTLTVDDVSGGTFCVTSLGMHGVDFFTPIVNPPNVAILGVGRIRETVGWADGGPVPLHAMTLSLTIDHRAVDGAPGALFLASVRRYLEDPERLLRAEEPDG